MALARAIRLGYCIDSFDIGGTELNAIRTLEAIDRQRFAVTVFHFHRDGPLRARYEALGIPLVHLKIGPLYSHRTALQGVRLLSLLRGEGIEVVHTHDLYSNIVAAPLARLAGCRVIASRRWLDATPRRMLVPLNRWSYRFAHRVVTNSALTARLLARDEGVPARRIVEVPNFLEQHAFNRASPQVRDSRRRSWHLPRDAFVVGTVARLVPVKNHAMLLRAIPHLEEDVHLVLVGDGPSRRELEDLARELRIGSRVHFVGPLVESDNLHQYLDVSVLCSRSEGFPNSVIEALAVGVPVAATPVGGVPEVIVDRQTGLLVPLDQPAALAEALRELRRDTELRQRLVQAGLACVRTRYHQSVVIPQLEALYLELACEFASRRGLLT
jgi:glycosyltransferase involved in cell wall biosynthesis